MNRREFLLLGACAAAAGCASTRSSAFGVSGGDVAAFWKAVEFLESTGPEDYDSRQEALAVAQKMIYAMKPADNPYVKMVTGGLGLPAVEVEDLHARFPALDWYDREFDCVLAEVRTTAVTADRPAVWYVYNMGVIVKTAQSTFSIDLCHRKAVEAVPLLDFALVTHNHEDHYSQAFLRAMVKKDRPVISNFYLHRGWYCRDLEKTIALKDVTVRLTTTDHNRHLIGAVACFEVAINRGAGREPFVIFHSGDSHRADQIRCSVPHPDVFVGHCAIGFSYPKAYQTTMRAKKMVIAHHQELGHLWSQWRCVGFHEEPAKIMSELRNLGADAVMPVWGDRIV